MVGVIVTASAEYNVLTGLADSIKHAARRPSPNEDSGTTVQVGAVHYSCLLQ